MTALKLEFAALEGKLAERDATIAGLHAEGRAAARAARKTAAAAEARVSTLRQRLDAVAPCTLVGSCRLSRKSGGQVGQGGWPVQAKMGCCTERSAGVCLHEPT